MLLLLAIGMAALQAFVPGWWLVPGAVVQMTGQRVPRQPEPPVAAEASAATPATPRDAAPVVVAPPVPQPTATPAPPAGALLPRRRFTILLLGSDDDRKFPPSAVLTQSMILVSVDPASRDVALISIPRDFWVPIAGYGNKKIDVAYEVGGIALARTTVERLFGVTVDYYAWVGLEGLVSVIDTLGGIELTVAHPVLDEMYPDDLEGPDPYAYHRLYIPAGPQRLDGRTALQYVRSRHGDLQSDFGRSARQQQVLVAIRRLADEPSIVGRIPELTAAMQGSVRTDLSLPAIAQLELLAEGIPDAQIHRQILSAPRFARIGMSPDRSEQVVYPNWDAIRPEIATLMHLSETPDAR